MRLSTVAVFAFLCASAFAQKPTPAQQQQSLDTAREIAIHYTSKLPDFLCTEDVSRSDRTSPTNIQVDRLTIQLSYNDQKEHYKLIAINGNKTQQSFESLSGMISGGEFGSLLRNVFDVSSAAQFQWKDNISLRKHAAVVYLYKIARANSHYQLGYRNPSGEITAASAGFHGEVTLDAQTSHVLRLTATADDMPKDSNILASSFEVDYDETDVASKKYLLPSRSQAHMERGYRQIGNVITYGAYRKFEADSTITFK